LKEFLFYNRLNSPLLLRPTIDGDGFFGML